MVAAFKGDTALKEKYIERVKKHRDADEIVQGKYWEHGKGCAVGCTLEYDNADSDIHQRMEDELGVPQVIARLEDRIFEGLTNGEAKEFPLQFLEAIKPGADLSLVMPKFFVWLLVDPADGVIQFAREDGKKAIQHVADLYTEEIAGKEIAKDVWRKAAATATATATYATATAATAAAAATAYAAAAATAYAATATATAATAYATYAALAAYATYATYATATWRTAKGKYYRKMADKLLELLQEA